MNRLLDAAAWLSRTYLRLPLALLSRTVPEDLAPGLDPQARVALATHAFLGARPPESRPLAAARSDMERAAHLLAPPRAPDVRAHDVAVRGATGPLAARLYRSVHAPTRSPALVFFHGGGFVLGGLATHDALCREIASATRTAVLAVAYRLAPEFPFPAAPDDALAAFRATVGSAESFGLDPRRLAVGGDSAGGTLSAVVALDTRGDDVRPIFQWLIYPATDLTRSWPSINRFGRGYFLERPTLDWFARQYLPNSADERHPRASPWFAADLTGLPPAYIATAAFDPLVDEATAYAARLRRAGVRTTHVDHPTLFHGYAATTGGIAAARSAMNQAYVALADAYGLG